MQQSCRILKCLTNINLQNSVKESNVFNCVLECNRRYCKPRFRDIKRKPLLTKPRMIKLDSPQFKSCLTKEVEQLKDLFLSNGYELRIVGGAVRDLLLGIQPVDLDFATTATPSEMKEMFVKENYRLINVNGEKHGTITTRINDKNFEVTTLRIDVTTDGRRAEVRFTKDWILDANRRDLTINSMYLGFDGTVYDYFNGYEDLKNRRVVFVGNATERIQEDYLRILRYFRFYGRIALVPDSHDEDVIKAITENTNGLEWISGERIWMELNKILSGRFAGELLEKMLSLGIGPYIGLPKNGRVLEMKKVWDRLKMKDVQMKPVTLLCTLFETEEELNNFCLRVKPSCAERDLGYFILNKREETTSQNSLKFYQSQYILFRFPQSSIMELLKYKGEFDLLKEFSEWTPPRFPINGHMLKEKGVTGKNLSLVLQELKEIWLKNDYDISVEELLERIPHNLLVSPTPVKHRRKQ